jgi:signal transduction histidine kinase/CheY-like chemotaxis protein
VVYQLELHRIELELQNQALQEWRVEAETAMSRLAEMNGHLEAMVADRTSQLETALQKSETSSREKSRFLSNMSHELRTPISAIMGMTLLAKRLAVDPEQLSYLETVTRSLRHLHGVINDILDISKIEAGKLCTEESEFTLDGVFDVLKSMVTLGASEKGLQLVFELSPECGRARLTGDPLKLGQVLTNLVGNAVKFTDRGSIHVRSIPVERGEHQLRVRFEIEDTGVGIAAEDQTRLFRPFVQLDDSLARTRGGTGLGLAISRHLVTAMGGQIGVASAVGEGSLFWFEMPLKVGPNRLAAAVLPAAADPERGIQSDHPGARVLVAEDDPINLEFLRILLRRTGLQVDTASTGMEAVIAARSVDYQLILMDLRMPGMDGLAATVEIRALPGHRETPIIALTADVFEEDRARCLAAGMTAHLGKPVEPDLLFSTLLGCLQQRKG